MANVPILHSNILNSEASYDHITLFIYMTDGFPAKTYQSSRLHIELSHSVKTKRQKEAKHRTQGRTEMPSLPTMVLGLWW